MPYSFINDYSEGCHHEVLKALIKTNYEQSEGYGLDRYSLEAAEMLKKEMKRDDVMIHFLCGGTQANLVVIGHALRPYEAIIACDTGHINTHESGSIEMTGHKIIPVLNDDGKLNVAKIEAALAKNPDEHTVKAGMVYLSNSTETGSVYNKAELTAISTFCKEKGLLLFVDGARIGNAMMSEGNDLWLEDYARLCDAFYIGGTKNGALFGEAVVLCNPCLFNDFRHSLKQHGAMLAKGRVAAIQFWALFKDGIYYANAKRANELAQMIAEALNECRIEMAMASKTNQIFPILPQELVDHLAEKYDLGIWEKIDERFSVYRIVTSWATEEEKVRSLIKDIKEFYGV